MPSYESRCHKCNKEYDYIRPVSKYLDTPVCCGVPTVKEMRSTPLGYMQGDLDYKCPVTDQIVTNHRQRKNIEAEHEITVIEPGMFKPRKKEKAPELPKELQPHLQKELKKLAAEG